MAKEMLPCPVPGCDRRRSPQYMMCRSDWWRVRHDTRAAVYAAWDNFHNDPAAYREIRDEAIAQAVASRARAAAK
jgi:hypothetical protein